MLETTDTMWRTVGHDRAVNTLRRGLQGGRLSHAYLVVGPRHVGKMTLALDLSRAVNCLAEERPCGECSQCNRIANGLHADVRVVGVEKDHASDGRSRVAIGIDQVRDVQREASRKPYEGRYRVFIFDGAEHLSEEAANSLLKVLEEPPDQVIIVVLALDAARMPSTIVSRCQLLELRPLPLSLVAAELKGRYDVSGERAEEIARLSGGRLGWALEALDRPDVLEERGERLATIEEMVHGGLETRFAYAAGLASSFSEDREALLQELGLWLEWWRDVLEIGEGAPDFVTNISRLDGIRGVAGALSRVQVVGALRAVQETSDHLEHNVSPRLALEGLMLALPRP